MLKDRLRYEDGSSPLTRGKRGLLGGGLLRRRLIPAHAGKTFARVPVGKTCAAHPRSRGENTVPSPSVPPEAGSSPLTRGKLGDLHPGRSVRRLIPAHAGKTRLWSGATRTWPAHPRSRGENHRLDKPRLAQAGSSPLTRGKPRLSSPAPSPSRLIPAHAGKTQIVTTLVTTLVGSSPLTRGKRCTRSHTGFPQRLIPAHAGKTR